MKEEINQEWYCSTGHQQRVVGPKCYGRIPEKCQSCSFKHRKWPTPEQFKEEYGEDYSEDGPVWFKHSLRQVWGLNTYEYAKAYENKVMLIVCACTPWGKPPAGWRPE